MNFFGYRNGVLSAEEVALDGLASRVGTPFYCYSSATLERHYKVFAAAMPADSLIAFSVKANGNLAVLRTLQQLGAGADVVSAGELKKARAAGIPAEKIVFSGVGKTRDEMALALTEDIYQFNVESEPELEALDELAQGRGKRAPVTMRVNPDVDARTHAKITTGTAATKFGIPFAQARDVYRKAATLKGIAVTGIDVHIGSQITDLFAFEAAFRRVAELAAVLRGDGHTIARLDLGGGLGVAYGEDSRPPPDVIAYGAAVSRLVGHLGCRLIFEPGRLIAANAGVLIARVIYVKQTGAKTFLILDAGMNDLIRPALYDSHHEIVPVREPEAGAERAKYDVVGPVCETSDLFAGERLLPKLKSGDLVAIRSAGAYGAVMSSSYNARPPAPEVLVRAAEWSIVRGRLTHDDLIAQDHIAPWLAQ
ncbi:MAG: diaminopimelate decarboxylase [Rhizomicrobium sp.]